jgi:hypothetical protein
MTIDDEVRSPRLPDNEATLSTCLSAVGRNHAAGRQPLSRCSPYRGHWI